MSGFVPRSELVQDCLAAYLDAEVSVDLHTHLFPPSHGSLCLYGIDAMLAYHYLVSELYTLAGAGPDLPPLPPPEEFLALPLAKQADYVWERLFAPSRRVLSEAQLGVITTLRLLGAPAAALAARSLPDLRAWYAAAFPTADAAMAAIFRTAGVRRVVMTNAPADPKEVATWHAAPAPHPAFSAALRVDPLLMGDEAAVARAYGTDPIWALSAWARRMRVEYIMASTPAGWAGPDAVFRKYLAPLARALRLPLAIKVGVRRGVRPEFGAAGDGTDVTGWQRQVEGVARVAREFPDLGVCVTVLEQAAQHDLCVVAREFGNVHVYGAWWYCNTPSILAATTKLRLELLGSAFTAQHSDARVADQLVYKWAVARRACAAAAAAHYAQVEFATGVPLTRAAIKADAEWLFGGAYSAFVAAARAGHPPCIARPDSHA